VIPRNFKPWPNKPGIFVTQIKPRNDHEPVFLPRWLARSLGFSAPVVAQAGRGSATGATAETGTGAPPFEGQVKRDSRLLPDLEQRVRDVRQSPDGHIVCLLTDHTQGRLRRLEPGR